MCPIDGVVVLYVRSLHWLPTLVTAFGCIGWDRIGTDRIGMDWNGLEWIGMDWSGLLTYSHLSVSYFLLG